MIEENPVRGKAGRFSDCDYMILIDQHANKNLTAKMRDSLSEHDNKLKQLKRHEGCIVGDPEDIIHKEWSQEWCYEI